MVFDLMLHSSDELPPVEDRGNLAGDLDALAGRIVALVAGPLGRRIFPGLIGDAAGDPALMERLRKHGCPGRTQGDCRGARALSTQRRTG